jgi:hypothetical protein
MANSDISGQITDGSGNPVASAGVYLWREDRAGAGGVVAERTADSNGNFEFKRHPDADNTTQSWHVAADDPAQDVQLQSAYAVTAEPFPSFPVGEINWATGGDNETGFTEFEFADNDRQANDVRSIGFQ